MKSNKMNKVTKLETLKGAKDCLPEEQLVMNDVISVIKKNFEKCGFRPFDTPLIEYLDVLTMKYDDDAEIVQEIFKVTDRGNRELGLRYDLTTPLSRFVASQKQLKMPFKRYQIGKVFRDGPIKKGRAREFIQCDGDVIGVKNIEIEAELLSMFYNTYSELGISSVIEINNNKILRGVLLQNNFKTEDLSSVILSVDKLKKIGVDGVLKEIEEKGLDIKEAKDSVNILNFKTIDEVKKVAKNDLLKEGIDELEKLVNLISNLGVEFRINFSMARGLDIYTGNIWEMYDKEKKITSSLGSGGRFDKLIGEYVGDSQEYPAVGVSYGIVPIMDCLKELGKLNDNKKTPTEILIVSLNEEIVENVLKIANDLRKKKNVEVYYGYKLKKAFDYADYLGIENIMIIGEKEIELKKATLKNLKTKKENEVKLNF